MGMISWMSNEAVLALFSMGLPGLIFVMFVVHTVHTWRMMFRSSRENAKWDKERAEERARYDRERAADRELYNTGLAEVRQMYENNASLVRDYDKLSNDLMGTLQLNTQTLTRLVEKVNNNMFCPQVREKGPNRL